MKSSKSVPSFGHLLLLFVCLVVGCISAQASPPETEPKVRLAKAEAMFAERCKKSGEFIYRKAENVEGVFLLKIREEGNSQAQFELHDPYGHDSTSDEYIKSFLLGRNVGGFLTNDGAPRTPGYRYVEAVDPVDGKRYRYTGSVKEVTRKTSILMGGDGRTTFATKEYTLDKVPAPGAPPRYGVTYDDLSTREEREYWIAGSSLKVIDLKTNEVIAERIGYLMDRGQGSKSGGRSPWLWAADKACPSFWPDQKSRRDPAFSYQVGQTRNFVEKVLKPKGTE